MDNVLLESFVIWTGLIVHGKTGRQSMILKTELRVHSAKVMIFGQQERHLASQTRLVNGTALNMTIWSAGIQSKR